jgi:hypothetical protein
MSRPFSVGQPAFGRQSVARQPENICLAGTAMKLDLRFANGFWRGGTQNQVPLKVVTCASTTNVHRRRQPPKFSQPAITF